MQTNGGEPADDRRRRRISRGRITAGELAKVCACYDLGDIESVRKFSGGSHNSPKVLLVTSTGPYLLKRRAPGTDDPYSVAISHEIQIHLADSGVPVPRLVGTRREHNSMLQLDGRVYEVFRFVPGTPYDRSPEATVQAGRTLGACHAALVGFSPTWPARSPTYHALADAPQRFEAVRDRLRSPAARATVRRLRDAYAIAAAAADGLGFGSWRTQLIHGDWHAGNLLFRDQRVVAVVDFDTARDAPPVVDLANGLLQFSLLGGGNEPSNWPAHADETRFRAFAAGYRATEPSPISDRQYRGIPWLMIEALILEAVTPIAATGRFAGLDPHGVLSMALSKAEWLRASGEMLTALAAPSG